VSSGFYTSQAFELRATMKRLGIGLIHRWGRLGPAVAALCRCRHAELPLPRLLRLSLFQVTVGMATG
jgi:BCD family chlorophyll transporter-like MFS transporter